MPLGTAQHARPRAASGTTARSTSRRVLRSLRGRRARAARRERGALLQRPRHDEEEGLAGAHDQAGPAAEGRRKARDRAAAAAAAAPAAQDSLVVQPEPLPPVNMDLMQSAPAGAPLAAAYAPAGAPLAEADAPASAPASELSLDPAVAAEMRRKSLNAAAQRRHREKSLASTKRSATRPRWVRCSSWRRRLILSLGAARASLSQRSARRRGQRRPRDAAAAANSDYMSVSHLVHIQSTTGHIRDTTGPRPEGRPHEWCLNDQGPEDFVVVTVLLMSPDLQPEGVRA
jgi:hypothetical protein